METLRKYLIQTITLLVAIVILITNRVFKLDVKELETIAYCIVTLDVFSVILKADILKGLTLFDLVSIPDSQVKKLVMDEISVLKKSIAGFIEKKEFTIRNPIVARDISFDMIIKIQMGDKIFSSMNLAERPFLLQLEYTDYFNKINREAIQAYKKKPDITRVLVVSEDIKQSDLYQEFYSVQKNIGVNVIECDSTNYRKYFDQDLIIRISGKRKEMVLGGKEPKTPLDKYEAIYLAGPNVNQYISKFNALISFIQSAMEKTGDTL